MPYKDPENQKINHSKWFRNNKEKAENWQKDWNKLNPEKFRAIQKRYYEKVKLKRANIYMELRLSAIIFLGGRCQYNGICDNSDERVLEFHHINGNDLDESGKKLFLHVLSNPEEFQLLCANHHRIVTRENVNSLEKDRNV